MQTRATRRKVTQIGSERLLTKRAKTVDVKQWFDTVRSGTGRMVAKLLAADPTLIDAVNKDRPPDGPTALHIAAFREREKIITLLLAAKPNLTLIDETGSTVLHVAASRSHAKVVKLLLAAKSSAGATDFDGCTALHRAAKSGSDVVMEVLLAACPTLLDAVDEQGGTALLYAVKRQHAAIVDHLLTLKPKNLEAVDANGMNVLHHAICGYKEEFIWRLLEMRPSLISCAAGNGLAPLCMKMWCGGNASTVMKLFELYPQAAVTHIDKLRLLQIAVRDDNDSSLDLMLPMSTFDQIVTAFQEDKKGCEGRLRPLLDTQCSPLSMILGQNVMGIVNEYLFGGKPPQRNMLSGDGPPADAVAASEALAEVRKREQWFNAARNGGEQLVAQLLAQGPALVDTVIDRDWVDHEIYTSLPWVMDNCASILGKPNLDEANGMTALHLAVVRGRENVVRFLLAASPSLGLKADCRGTTALMKAALGGHLKVAELILDACPASLDLVDHSLRTALLCASSYKFPEIVRVLLAANPQNLEATDPSNMNVLHHEVCYGHVEHVEKILALNPSLINTQTRDRQTPLWLAVNKQQSDNELVEKLFVLCPQAVHMFDCNALTPFHGAVLNHNEFALRLFLPKLTSEDISCAFRRFTFIFPRWGEKARSLIDVQRKDAAKVEALASVPAVMDIVYEYFGLGKPKHTG